LVYGVEFSLGEAGLTENTYTTKQEKDVLAALGRGLRDEFPNPERVGCPGREVVAAIAAHRMPLSQAEPYLDHLGSCSPCYRDFLQLQTARRRRRTRIIFAVAASVLIVVGLATLAIVGPHGQQMARAVIDLRGRSMARGTESPPSEPPIPIARNISHLDIYLPLGSSDGSYEVRVASSSGKTLFAETAEAKLEQGTTVLRINLRAPLTKSGGCVLQIRRPNSEWVSFPLRIL
jgi:hypothetical protein